MKRRLVNLALVLMMLSGLALMLYPTASDWLNRQRQSRVMEQYQKTFSQQPDSREDASWEAALAYNQNLLDNPTGFHLSPAQLEEYNALMNSDGTGLMGIISIPKIDVELPLYHGTDEQVLKTAVGHIPGTSLPTGGQGTHSVFSGHRGLPSARLFTGLDALEVGDRFVLRIMGRSMTYQVDQILVVLPDETQALAIDPELDLCTLVTCTPYGVNTHRLLVRGRRVEAGAEGAPARVVSDARRLDTLMAAPIAALPLAAALIVVAFARPGRRRKDTENHS